VASISASGHDQGQGAIERLRIGARIEDLLRSIELRLVDANVLVTQCRRGGHAASSTMYMISKIMYRRSLLPGRSFRVPADREDRRRRVRLRHERAGLNSFWNEYKGTLAPNRAWLR